MIKKYLTVGMMALALTACGRKGDTPETGAEASSKAVAATAASNVDAAGQASLRRAAGDTINFAFDRYNLSDDAIRILDAQATWLVANPSVNVIIEGHTDDRGTRKYNQALGERRANAGKRYLVSKGISTRRITTVSYGKDRPIDTAQTEDAWAKNRRAVTVVVR